MDYEWIESRIHFFGKSRDPTEDLKRENRIQYPGPQAYEA
jgi:hypothetical protein